MEINKNFFCDNEQEHTPSYKYVMRRGEICIWFVSWQVFILQDEQKKKGTSIIIYFYGL